MERSSRSSVCVSEPPPVSLCYLMFFSSEVRAFTTALKASSLPGATHLSGCSRTASFLYALFTSSLKTSRNNSECKQQQPDPWDPTSDPSAHRVAPGFTPSMSQESLLLRMRRMVSACSLVKPTLTSVTGRFPPFSHMSVMDEKKD